MEILRARGPQPDPEIVARAESVLARGGLLIYPTDTLYALGGRALDPAAARRVCEVKQREPGKPLPVVAADLDQARSLCRGWPEAAARLAGRYWPGPLTLVLPAAAGLPADVSAGSGTVALRVPALRLTRALCARSGPLIATSANRAGGAAPVTCDQAVAAVGDAAGLALDAGPGGPTPSTIVDLTTAPPRLLRAGAVGWDDVRGVLALP
jgi:L-threonylcarbamoyladenylate synthase